MTPTPARCNTNATVILFGIKSLPKNIDRRELIRKTWLDPRRWWRYDIEIKVVFIVGKGIQWGFMKWIKPSNFNKINIETFFSFTKRQMFTKTCSYWTWKKATTIYLQKITIFWSFSNNRALRKNFESPLVHKSRTQMGQSGAWLLIPRVWRWNIISGLR